MVVALNCAVCPAIFTETVEPASVIPPAAVPPRPTNAMIGAALAISAVIAIQNEPDRSFVMEVVGTITGLVLVYAVSLLTQRPVVCIVLVAGWIKLLTNSEDINIAYNFK